MSLLNERGHVAVEVEAVKGVAETLLAADVLQVFDPQVTPGIELGDRNTFEPSFDKRSSVVGNRMWTVVFRVPVHGSGTVDVPPLYRDLLVGCALAETINAATDVDYDPVTDLASQVTVTLAVNKDGKQYLLTGAAGNVKWIFAENDVPVMEFTFVGIYTAPTDTALFTGFTFGAINPPNPVGVTASWDANTLLATTIEVDLGNNVQAVRSITTATGIRFAAVVDREPVATADPEEEDVATVDWVDEMVQATLGIFTFTIGATAGNIHTVSMPSSQITGVTYAERDGIVIANLTIKGRANSDEGDDSFQYKTA